MSFTYTLYKQGFTTQEYVDSIYHIQANLSVFQNAILPDGKVDVVVLLKPAYKIGEKNPYLKPGFYVQTNRDQINEFELSGEIELIGIRFFPHHFFRVFGLPPSELKLGIQSLMDFFPFAEQILLSKLFDEQNPHAKMVILERWLADFIKKNTFHFAFEHALVNKITLMNSKKTLDEICSDTSVYKRLQRYFSQVVGTSPKQYQRLLRLDALHQLLLTLSPNDIRWQDIVYELGFYDQSHLNKEVKSLLSLTPSEFLIDAKKFM